MASVRFPDFYIIGAPKSGTTALFSYLASHPSVFLPGQKEPHYFAKDFENYRRVKSAEAYLALFHGAAPYAVRGEGSVWYLYSSAAVREIARVRPDAKLIVLLRNPVHAALAMHAEHVIGLSEDISDFALAWHAQRERAVGKNLPHYCPEPSMLQYGKIFSYSEQITRLHKHFPREQIKVVLFEELFGDPQNVYRQVLLFLGLEPQHKTSFERVNVRRMPKHLTLHRLISRPPFLPKSAFRALIFLSRKFGLHLGVWAKRLTGVRAVDQTSISPTLHRELMEHFADDIVKLEVLLGRSLNIWRS